MPKDNLLSILFKTAGGLASSYPGFKESEEDRRRVEKQQKIDQLMRMLNFKQNQQQLDLQREKFEYDKLEPNRIAGRDAIKRMSDYYTQMQTANKPAPIPAEMQKLFMLRGMLNPDEFKQYLGVGPQKEKAPKPTTMQSNYNWMSQKFGPRAAYNKMFNSEGENPLDMGMTNNTARFNPDNMQDSPIDPSQIQSGVGIPAGGRNVSDMPSDWPGTLQEWEDYKRMKGL